MPNPNVTPTPPAPAAKTPSRQSCRRNPPAPAHTRPRRRPNDATRGAHRASRSTADAYLAGHLGTTRLIAVRGEMDLFTADALFQSLKVLAGPPPQRITLDLSEVAFIDCTGLRALDGLYRLVLGSGGGISISATSPAATRLFDLVDWPGSK